MKNNQKLTILFWLRKGKATKDGRAPLYARVTIDGKDDDISLGRKVHPNDWEVDLKLVKGKDKEAKATNDKIDDAKATLKREFGLLQLQYKFISPLMLKNAFLNIPVAASKQRKGQDAEAKPQQTLIGAVDDFIIKFEKQTENHLRSKETLRQWRTTRNKIQAFLIFKYKAKDITLREIKYAFAEDFYDYLTLEVDYPLDDVTAKKHIKKTKQILAGCVTREYLENNPLQQYKCGGENKLVMPLEFEDVMKLYKKEIRNDRLAEVRDAFIFQCFTGFAYQDVYALNPSHITKVGSKGERWLQKDRGKTKVLEMVPLLPVAEEIIARYANHPYCRIKNCLLPINSNARYNNYLKELAVICDIDRELNTHLARHTFADMMLNNGVPIEDVARMLGHKNIRTTQRYTKVAKGRIKVSMGEVRNRFFDKDGKFRNFEDDHKEDEAA